MKAKARKTRKPKTRKLTKPSIYPAKKRKNIYAPGEIKHIGRCWPKGQSGNPKGKIPGTENHMSRVRRKFVEAFEDPRIDGARMLRRLALSGSKGRLEFLKLIASMVRNPDQSKFPNGPAIYNIIKYGGNGGSRPVVDVKIEGEGVEE